MLRTAALSLILLGASSAEAVVIRHDVDDSAYRIDPSEFPALADMPTEGHGVLIAPRWVVTAAHAVPRNGRLTEVEVGGVKRAVDEVFIHPGASQPPEAMINRALDTGDWILTVFAIASSDDVALVRLKDAVHDVEPVALYRDADEIGSTVKIIGKGATGTGLTGHSNHGPNRGDLRRAFNVVTSANDRWICYVFDGPETALPLEGKTGSGDSGGPLLIEDEKGWTLAGLASWGFIFGDVKTTSPGLYGQLTCNVRVSKYVDWIETVMAANPAPAAPGDAGPPPLVVLHGCLMRSLTTAALAACCLASGPSSSGSRGSASASAHARQSA